MVDGVKETICSGCAHLQVCSLRNDMLSVISSIDNLTVNLGDNRTVHLSDIPWVKPISLQCIHYLQKEVIFKRDDISISNPVFNVKTMPLKNKK